MSRPLFIFFLGKVSYLHNQVLFALALEAVTFLIGVFVISKGDVLNIDPMKFYTHLYKTLFKLHAGTYV